MPMVLELPRELEARVQFESKATGREPIAILEAALDQYLSEEPNEETLAAFEDIEAGRNLIGPFEDVDSLFEALMEGDDE